MPTAATIEHVKARSRAGGSAASNLAIACPWCNTHKGDRPVEEFLARRMNEIPVPDDLETDTVSMLGARFGVRKRSGVVSTGTPNSKLEVKDGVVTLLVRASNDDDWRRFRLGSAANRRVTAAAYDFLMRHYTPPRPRRRPPRSAFVKNSRRRPRPA